MVDVLVWDNGSVFRNSYGDDMRMLDKALSATGFGSIDFTPVNIDHTVGRDVNYKRRKIVNDVDEVDQRQRFKCGICTQTFSVKKSRDRHRDSVHKQQEYPCPNCSRIFTRKDMRTRHQNEKHNGRRRPRQSLSNIANASASIRNDQDNVETIVQTAASSICVRQSSSTPVGFVTTRSESPLCIDFETGLQMIDDMTTCRQSSSTPMEFQSRMSDSPASVEDLEPQSADDDVEGLEPTHNRNSPVSYIDLRPIDNALLLCTNLLIRSKPYKRFFIHDKKRDLLSRKKWRTPHPSFWEFYGLAIRTLRLQLASDDPDAELLAAVAAFVNVDVLINGAEMMGYHARAMYALKAHHRSRRDPIFDALEAAFAQCGKVCRTVRIIYTKHGFVWMLNVSLLRRNLVSTPFVSSLVGVLADSLLLDGI